MKKRTMTMCAGILAVNLMLTFSACQSDGADGVEEAETENKMTAVYLTDQEGSTLFVQPETDMVFHSTIPEGELYDEEGNKISEEDLNNGDVLEITGNGMIAESYPAQYYGIFKMQRTETENTEYAEKYQGLLEQFTVKEDPKEVPYLDVSYSQPDAMVAASVQTGGYTWSYETETGETETIAVDSAHILQWQWQDGDEMKISGSTDMELLFSKKPEEVRVVRWPAADKTEPDITAEVDFTEGESVQVLESPEGNPQITAEPDFVYLVEATWENGEAQYGFCTAQIE